LLTQFILNQAGAGADAIQPLPAKSTKTAGKVSAAARRPVAKKAVAKTARKKAVAGQA